MQFDGSGVLFRLAARSKPAAQILEIPKCRYWGGSAPTFAVASDHDSMVTSIDIARQRSDELSKRAPEEN